MDHAGYRPYMRGTTTTRGEVGGEGGRRQAGQAGQTGAPEPLETSARTDRVKTQNPATSRPSTPTSRLANGHSHGHGHGQGNPATARPYPPGYQDDGVTRSRTAEFRRHRERGTLRLHLEENRLAKRLSKLLEIWFRTQMPAEAVSATAAAAAAARGATGTTSPASRLQSGFQRTTLRARLLEERRTLEVQVVAWERDEEATVCPLCLSEFSPATGFNVLRRLAGLKKHHCRLCGRLVCGQTRTGCTVKIVPRRATTTMGEGVAGDKAPVTMEERGPEDPEDGIRICKECRVIVGRHDALADLNAKPDYMVLWEQLKTVQKEISDSLTTFQDMVLALSSTRTSTIPPDVVATRKRLLDNFTQVDRLSKRILACPTDGNASRERLQFAISLAAKAWLQEKMVPLRALPSLKDEGGNEGTGVGVGSDVLEKVAVLQLADDDGGSGGGGDVDAALSDPAVRAQMTVLREQERLVTRYIEEATKKRRLDDARTLRGSLLDLRREMDRLRGLKGMQDV